MEQAVRDGIMDRNRARIIGWQRDYRRAEDELDNPRSLALPDWQALCEPAAASSAGRPITSKAGATWLSSPPALRR